MALNAVSSCVFMLISAVEHVCTSSWYTCARRRARVCVASGVGGVSGVGLVGCSQTTRARDDDGDGCAVLLCGAGVSRSEAVRG